jgi:hypothetical protein
MRRGKTHHANAIAAKLGTIIARNNSSKLSHIKPKEGTKDLWNEVKRLTKRGHNTNLNSPITFHSDMLNSHYATVSSDNNYSAPPRKATAQESCEYVTDIQVFNLLDKLKPTSSGPDDIPFWFLRIAAPIIAAPLTYLINLSFSSSVVPYQ